MCWFSFIFHFQLLELLTFRQCGDWGKTLTVGFLPRQSGREWFVWCGRWGISSVSRQRCHEPKADDDPSIVRKTCTAVHRHGEPETHFVIYWICPTACGVRFRIFYFKSRSSHSEFLKKIIFKSIFSGNSDEIDTTAIEILHKFMCKIHNLKRWPSLNARRNFIPIYCVLVWWWYYSVGLLYRDKIYLMMYLGDVWGVGRTVITVWCVVLRGSDVKQRHIHAFITL